MLTPSPPMPMSDQERTTLLIQNLIDSESERWRTMPEKPGRQKSGWLGRVLAGIGAVLRRL
jgi:hypothetical protein